MNGDVVGFPERRGEADAHVLEATCANPRCDEQFPRPISPGRRKEFHSEECRRDAERDYRQLTRRLAHYTRQTAQMQARLNAYLRTHIDEDAGRMSGPSVNEVERARLAVAEVRGMARFLRVHDNELAQDLLNLFEAVEPLVRSRADN